MGSTCNNCLTQMSITAQDEDVVNDYATQTKGPNYLKIMRIVLKINYTG